MRKIILALVNFLYNGKTYLTKSLNNQKLYTGTPARKNGNLMKFLLNL